MNIGKITKTFTSKKGNTVIIRYPKPGDLDDVLKFANALVQEDTFVMLNQPMTREEEEKWLTDTLEKMEKGKKIQLVCEVNGVYAGNCEIRRRDKRQSHVGEIGISMAKAYREEGIGTQLLNALIDEGKRMGLRLLVLYCFETNARALHIYEKLGFRHAGLIPEIYAYKGSFIGEAVLYLPLV